MGDYCTPRDVYSFGAPAGTVPNEARLCNGGADTAANTLSLDGHGFALNDPLDLRADGAGGQLPAPLAPGVRYFAVPLTDNAFQLAAAPDGPVIDLTTSGARVLVTAPLPIAAAISWASRVIDDMLPAHAVPLAEPVPEIIKMTAAELAAGKLAALRGAVSQTLAATVDAAQKRLARWATNVPVRGATEPTRTGLAAAAAPRRDASGWSRFGGF